MFEEDDSGYKNVESETEYILRFVCMVNCEIIYFKFINIVRLGFSYLKVLKYIFPSSLLLSFHLFLVQIVVLMSFKYF